MHDAVGHLRIHLDLHPLAPQVDDQLLLEHRDGDRAVRQYFDLPGIALGDGVVLEVGVFGSHGDARSCSTTLCTPSLPVVAAAAVSYAVALVGTPVSEATSL